jgi:hypothetical protein
MNFLSVLWLRGKALIIHEIGDEELECRGVLLLRRQQFSYVERP